MLNWSMAELWFYKHLKKVQMALCTNPSNVRRLSDDEIDKLFDAWYDSDDGYSDHEFARAIMDACNIPKEGE